MMKDTKVMSLTPSTELDQNLDSDNQNHGLPPFIYDNLIIPAIDASEKLKQIFITKLCFSLSLDIEEKKQVFEKMPELDLLKILQLIKVFFDETSKFQELSINNPEDIAFLQKKQAKEWEVLNKHLKRDFFDDFSTTDLH